MRALLKMPGVRAFLMVWSGQLVSMLGSSITSFALGIWIFQQSGSATQFTLMTFCAAAPPLLVLPFAGPLIDRRGRKGVLVACELAGAAATAAAGGLAWSGRLTFPLGCAIVAVMATSTALQWPTWAAAVTTLVPREHLGRASGLTQLANGMAQVLSPLLGGALMPLVGLAGIAAIDLGTFAVSVALLLAAAIPAAAPADGRPRRRYWADVPFGLKYIAARAGLAALLATFTAVSFFTEVAAVLFTPLVLTVSGPATLGTILALGSLGMILGGAIMGVWGGSGRPALAAALFAALSGAGVAAAGVAGMAGSVGWIAFGAGLYFFCEPLMIGSSQMVWQRSVPADAQGRVFATRAALASAAMPLASLAAGPLADGVAAQALAGGGPMARALRSLAGEGPGRAVGFILFAAGCLSVASALTGAALAPLRRLDHEETPAAAAPAEPAGAVP
ncbi:MAG TPA: MFS transporter [Candidatus Polarisedimenticolia bacterium]|nr:MFS transporter [Candidatus Polarisedimenticolia bacterium]